VLGRRSLDDLVLARWRTHVAGGTVWVYEGATRLHPATAADAGLPIMATWGYNVVPVIAEHVLVGGRELAV
jgi:hypothetical protein